MIFVHRINTILTIAGITLLLALAPVWSVTAAISEMPMLNRPVIYQLQTGSASSASQEFISIYNNSDQSVDITNWALVYSSSSGNTETNLGMYTSSSAGMHIMLKPYGSISAGTNEFKQAHPEVQLGMTFAAGIAGTSGHIRLIDESRLDVDVLGYGSATYPESIAKTTAPSGKILQRSMANKQYLKDTNNNSQDFYNVDLAIPNNGSYEMYLEPVKLTDIPLAITEILPNPAGTDTGREFIEFYNPNLEAVSLKNYIISIGPAYTKTYTLPDIVIEPEAYVALTDLETGITLPNTGAILKLSGPNGTEVMIADAYNQLPDDVVWAYDSNQWKASYTQTPGAQNEIIDSKPCASGYERNVNIGTCQKLTSSTLKSSIACPVGQVRNIETNRCRKIVTVTSAPCEAGKVKNLETGRCKKIEQLADQKTCPSGQERNAETNRCRKIVVKSSSVPTVKDVSTPLVENNAKWWAAGLASAGSVSYATYEWRQEVRKRTEQLRSLLSKLFHK